MSDSKSKLRVWVRPRLGGLYWTATNPDEAVGLVDGNTYYRGLTREEAVNKCLRANTPRESEWEELTYEV